MGEANHRARQAPFPPTGATRLPAPISMISHKLQDALMECRLRCGLPDSERGLAGGCRIRPGLALRLGCRLHLLLVMNSGKVFEVSVLGPELGVPCPRRGEDDAVRKWKVMSNPKGDGTPGQVGVEADHLCLHQERHGLQRGLFPALPVYDLANLQDGDGWDHEIIELLDGWREEVGTWPVGQILQPAARVDEVHRRSGSRSTLVSIPFRKPRISRIGRTGMSSMRSP